MLLTGRISVPPPPPAPAQLRQAGFAGPLVNGPAAPFPPPLKPP